MKKNLEPCKPVHLPWIEQTDKKEICWEPSGHDRYTGCSGGGKLDVSSAMKTVVRTAKYVIDVFLFIFPISLFAQIAEESDHYTYSDWVEQKDRLDFDDFTHHRSQRDKHIPPTQNAHHGANNEQRKYNITRSFVMAWLGILMVCGTLFSNNCKQKIGWMDPPL